MPSDYIWPLSRSTTPDEMNTSFGPRINRNRWDFHDGIDLPAPIGTKVYAVRGGTVYHAGPRNTGGFSSRHIVVEVEGAMGEKMYHVYVHLDTHNFTTPVGDRFYRSGKLMAARLLFGAPSKLEDDLKRVEVDLQCGPALLETRVVDFDDKTTVNKGNGDEFTYVNDIGVEGYQKSNMVAHGRTDLSYGIVLCNIPAECKTLIARVTDIGGNTSTSSKIAVPNRAAIEQCVEFATDQTPAGWSVLTSASGAGTSLKFEVIENHPTAAADCAVMVSSDTSATETIAQRAAIEYLLPEGCEGWTAEGWFNPVKLGLDRRQTIYLLPFLSEAGLSFAARLYKGPGPVWADIAARNPDANLAVVNSNAEIAIDSWHKSKLRLLHIGTRETIAVLYLDDDEKARINWDSAGYEPRKLRAGIRSSAGATATVLTAELRVVGSS